MNNRQNRTQYRTLVNPSRTTWTPNRIQVVTTWHALLECFPPLRGPTWSRIHIGTAPKGRQRMMYTNHHYNLHHPYHWYIGTALMMNMFFWFLLEVPSLSLDSKGYCESRTESSACVYISFMSSLKAAEFHQMPYQVPKPRNEWRTFYSYLISSKWKRKNVDNFLRLASPTAFKNTFCSLIFRHPFYTI